MPNTSSAAGRARLLAVLGDPTNRALPIREVCRLAGYSRGAWSRAMRNSTFREAVAGLGMRLPNLPSPDADAFGGFTTVAQQRIWRVLQDPANRALTPLEICRKAGYKTYTPWYHAVCNPAFRQWVHNVGIPYTPYGSPYGKREGGPVPLAMCLDGEWAQDRIDIRRLTTDYPKHKRGYMIDFSFIHNPKLKALIKRYFRARIGYWSGYTPVTVLPTLKPLIQELERRYAGLASFAPLTRVMIEPILALTGWTDGMNRYHPMTIERRLRALILLNSMFEYMRRHQWSGAPKQVLIYDEDFPKRPQHKPRPIPEMVIEQLLTHLEDLPPYDRHLVQIMCVMGLRCVDALHLREDCLEYDATGDPRVRWYNMKMKRDVRPLPVTKEVEAAILAQRELVKDVLDKHGQQYLFRVEAGVYTSERFRIHLNKFAKTVPILGPDGQVFHFRPHEFRHTVGTEMINNGMGIADVMTYLDHQSAEMTRNYAQIHDETLKRKFKEVVLSGRAVGGLALRALQEQIAQGNESELDWVVANLRKLSLPWGQCLHHAKAPKCPFGQNACFTKDNGPCHKLVTTPEHIPVIRATLADLRQSKQIADDKGWEMYANDLGAQMMGMEQVLSELELPSDQRPKNRGGQQ